MKGIALRAGCLPDLDFKTLISRAAAWGFDGLELDAVGGRTNLTAVPELTDDAERTQAELQQQNIAVQSLSLDVALDSQSPKENARRREKINFLIGEINALLIERGNKPLPYTSNSQ